MMRNFFLFAIAILALNAFTSEEFIGDENLRVANEDGGIISFNSGSTAHMLSVENARAGHY
jgi:hypothetical protein